MIIRAGGCDIAADEIFVSDGAKSDSGNIQEIFSLDNRIAVCDPVYPVYVDSNVMAGRCRYLRCGITDVEQCDLHAVYQRKQFCTGIPEGDTGYDLSVSAEQPDRNDDHKGAVTGMGRLRE